MNRELESALAELLETVESKLGDASGVVDPTVIREGFRRLIEVIESQQRLIEKLMEHAGGLTRRS